MHIYHDCLLVYYYTVIEIQVKTIINLDGSFHKLLVTCQLPNLNLIDTS